MTSYHLQYAPTYSGSWVDLNGNASNSLLSQYTVTGLTKGTSYKFRFRARNEIGWSDYSAETVIIAASAPSQPSKPTFVSATATSITLNFDTNVDNGGSPITLYTLEMNTGTTGSAFSPVASYASGSLTHTLTTATDNLVSGKIYTFRWYATNVIDDSDVSDETSAAVTASPIASTLVFRNMAYSTQTSMNIEWNSVSDGTSPGGLITGYVLTVKDCHNGTTWDAFNGVDLNIPSQTKITVLGLTPGREYKFWVTAYNYNGAGTPSSVYSFYSCVLPLGFSAPVRTDSTKTTIDIAWLPPSSNGGCDITGYAVFMDDGAGSTTFTEVNIALDPAVRDIPGLQSLQVTTFSSTDYGKDYVFYVTAFTSAGVVNSEKATITLADVPDTPTSSPSKNVLSISATKLIIDYPALASTENGGSTILSYSLEMDNGLGGSFSPVTGYTSNSLFTQ